MQNSWYCYCLQSDSKSTYIGATIEPDRRLSQHNRERSGGAKATGRATGWKRICCVTGFPTQRDALQFEWKWKQLSKRETGSPLEKRLKALTGLVNSEQSTQNATPFSSYDGPLCLFLEDPSCMHLQSQTFKYAIVDTLQ